MDLAAWSPDTPHRVSVPKVLALTACGIGAILISSALLGVYDAQILSQAFFFAVVAIAVDLQWGYAGILSWGQSAFFGIGVYGVAIASAHYGGGAPVAILGAIIAAVLAALVAGGAGWLSFWDGAPPFFVAIVTFAIPVVFTQLILSGGTYTGASSGLPFPTPNLAPWQWYRISGCLLVLVAIAAYVFTKSDAGRILVGIRENEDRCRYLGIRTARWKIGLMAVCAVFSAVAGTLYAEYATVAATSYGDFVFGTELVIWTALGGRGTLIGPILGTVFINYISAVLGGSLPFLWLLIIGLIFVFVVIYLPSGFYPFLQQWASRGLPILGQPFRGRLSFPQPEASGPPAGSDTRSLSPSLPAARGSVPRAAADRAVVLQIRAVQKSYGSLHVLRNISFDIRRGEVVGIVGPNGAGKTTLVRCISDGREYSAGDIAVSGRSTRSLSAQECVSLGVGRKFQTPSVFDALSVADCLHIARSFRQPPSLWRSGAQLVLPLPALRIAELTGLFSQLHVPASHLAHGTKQALELAMVLALEPTVLLLDEPTAGLTRTERAAVGSLLAVLAKEHDISVLLIEHDVDFVRTLCDRLVVLHMGEILMDGTVSEVVESEVVRSVYLGETVGGT